MIKYLCQLNVGNLLHLGGVSSTTKTIYSLMEALPATSKDGHEFIYREGDGSHIKLSKQDGRFKVELMGGTVLSEDGCTMCTLFRQRGIPGFKIKEMFNLSGPKPGQNRKFTGVVVQSLDELRQRTGIAFTAK